jgi:uncharacterized membrane protein
MFIRNIGKTVEHQLEPDKDTEGTVKMVKMYVYVEWAMGSLVSGILFFSSNIDVLDLTGALLHIAVIIVFALVSYYVLYELRNKLKKDEERGDEKKEALLKMKNQNGKLRVTDD